MKNRNFIIGVLFVVLLTSLLFGDDLKPEIISQIGHTKTIFSLEITPDGRDIASLAEDDTVKLWDINTGKEIRTFQLTGEVKYSSFSAVIKSISISNDGKKILICERDRINIFDMEKGVILKTLSEKNNNEYAVFSPDGNMILSHDNNKMYTWDNASLQLKKTFGEENSKSKIIKIIFLPDGKHVLSVSRGNNYTFNVWNVESGKKIKTLAGGNFKYNEAFYSMTISQDGKYAYTGSSFYPPFASVGVAKLRVWDINKGTLINSIEFKNNDTIYSIAASPDGKYISCGGLFHLMLLDITNHRNIKVLSDIREKSKSLVFSKDQKNLISSYDTIKVWNVSDMKLVQNLGGGTSYQKNVAFSPDNKRYVTGGELIYIWDISTGKLLKTLDNKDTFKMGETSYSPSLYLSPDGNFLLSISWAHATLFDLKTNVKVKLAMENLESAVFTRDSKRIVVSTNDYFRNTESTLKIFDLKGNILHSYPIPYKYSFVLGNDGSTVIISGNSTTIVMDLNTGNQIQNYTINNYIGRIVQVSPDSKYLVSLSLNEVIFWDIENQKISKRFIAHKDIINSLVISPNRKFLMTYSKDKTIKLWDAQTTDLIWTYSGHTSGVLSAVFSPDGKTVLTSSDDNTCRLLDSSTGKLIYMTAVNSNTAQWFVLNSDGYWDASSKGGDLVAMVKGLECWNIDQFAVKNNRPDLIYAKLPFKDDNLIEHYKNQYFKRLKKLGFVDVNGNPDETLLSKDYHVPEAKIIESKINSKFVDLKIELSDTLYSLKRYNIFVNDVPLFGAYGKEISGKSLDMTEKIELTTGQNKIEVSCMNEKGVESYRDLNMANYTPQTPVKPDLYYIGFGVSKYKDSKLNLQYADKDAKDLSDFYSKMKDLYSNIYTKTYINEGCTVENIKKAKDLLKNAKADDTFVLFIAGHGIHDTDKDATYYFVTHETDITNLSETAADFDIIEDIMQGISPRNKLFLMDTCESGEIDDDIQAEYFTMADNRGIKSRAIETERALKKKETTKKTKRSYLYEKDRYIYNDLVRRSGAIVFSSCKGGEFSYESDKVGNGFFTSKIIESLKGQTSDTDKDGKISIDELKSFVIAEVPKLADGKQNPTVDRDNIYQKFGFQTVK